MRILEGSVSSAAICVVVSLLGCGRDGVRPPEIVFTSPVADSAVSGRIVVQGTARRAKRVEVSIGGSGFLSAEGTKIWAIELDTTKVDDGQVDLIARAINKDFETTQDVISINVQNAEPLGVQITSPVVDSTASGLITVQGTATGADLVEASIGGTGFFSAVGTSNWTLELDTTEVDDGQVDLIARAINKDFEITQDVISINVHNTDPLIGSWYADGSDIASIWTGVCEFFPTGDWSSACLEYCNFRFAYPGSTWARIRENEYYFGYKHEGMQSCSGSTNFGTDNATVSVVIRCGQIQTYTCNLVRL